MWLKRLTNTIAIYRGCPIVAIIFDQYLHPVMGIQLINSEGCKQALSRA